MANDVKWIKLATDVFDNRKVKQIEKMPDGDTILVIWFKLLCLCGNVNDGGMVYFTKDLPYTDEMLATEFDRPITTVRLALSVFVRFGMIEIVDDIIRLTSWEKYQSVDRLAELREYNRLAQQRSRANRKQLQAVNDKSMTSQPCQDIEEEGDKDKEKEIHSFIPSTQAERDSAKLRYLGGTLGKGVVMLSEDQIESLLDILSIEEFNKYVGIVAECELNGQRFKKKTHYQAILEMAEKDRKIK
jgi:predicted phage replisome organizer